MGIRGIPPRSLHSRDPFPDRPTQNMITDGSPRKRPITPVENHPSARAPHFPHPQCTEGQDGGGVTAGGTSGTPTRFPPVWMRVGWAGKAAARHIAHPGQHPGHNRGRGRRVKGGVLLPFGSCGLRGIPSRSLRNRGPFSGRPTQNTLTDGPPRKRPIAPLENRPSQGPKHPSDFRVGGEGDRLDPGAGHPRQPSPQCLPSPRYHSYNP